MAEKHAGGRPTDYKTPEELQQKIDEYFDKECGTFPVLDKDNIAIVDNKGRPIFKIVPPTTCGLAYFLGYVSRQSIYDIEKRDDKFSYTIKRALLKCEQFAEEQLFGGRPVGAIFALKNRGWKDKQEIEHSGKIETSDIKEVIKDLKESLKDE